MFRMGVTKGRRGIVYLERERKENVGKRKWTSGEGIVIGAHGKIDTVPKQDQVRR